MNKPQKIVWGFFIVSLLVIGILSYMYYSIEGDRPNTDLQGTILYYGDTCPHCIIVDEFLTENNASSKIEYEHKEVILKEGDFINISAFTKHRVKYTNQTQPTIWLAIFY